MAIYNQEPRAVQYMPLPDGTADVWLRKNIQTAEDENGVAVWPTVEDENGVAVWQAVEDENGVAVWQADEVYFRTSLTEDDVTENFDALFASGGPVTDPDTGEESVSGVTTADRLDALEAAVLELAEVIANG